MVGPINLHNRDRFYTPWDSPVWNKRVLHPPDGYWGSQYPQPVPRGPVAVDTLYPIRISNNLLEVCKTINMHTGPPVHALSACV